MKLYLGARDPTWIGRSTVPLFVSLSRSRPMSHKSGERFPRRAALNGWALDSGGFTAVTRGGWKTSPEEYLESVYRLDDRCPGMEWAAQQDWMCEPQALAATGLTVEQHQRLTIENYIRLREIDNRELIVPTLQGWKEGDYVRCAEMYADAGVNLNECRLVCIGSICRRQASKEIEDIFVELSDLGLPLHGFGVKVHGLARYQGYLVSSDSMAWSVRARNAALHREPAPGSTCTHRSCVDCFTWAHEWHARMASRAGI